ncbi:MAG: N-acetylmuramoyl-L-alanine amidase [Spirochaetales bacterium]|nr:N-acetylmuramoyl-L-alanine amidase [Spirochaetales bacterium]
MAADDYYSVSTIVSDAELTAEFNNRLNCLYIHKNNKSVLIMNGCNYILFDGNKHFIDDFVLTENGQMMIPITSAAEILNFFSDGAVYSVEKGEIVKNDSKDNETPKRITERYYVYKPETAKNEQTVSKNDKPAAKPSQKPAEPAVVVTAAKKSSKIETIIIDPGHGGKDPGAIGYNNIREKDIVLSVGLMVQKKLTQMYPNKKIIMTRDKDVFIPLEERSNIANRAYSKYGNAIFVSIHVNSSRAPNSFGFETWHLTANYKRDVVDKKKVSDDAGIANIVNLMMTDEIYNESKDLAQKIQNNLETQIGYVSKNRGIKQEQYFVIKKSVMPAVLVEIGFNSNKYEAIRLTNYNYRSQIRDGICGGLKEFITSYERSK